MSGCSPTPPQRAYTPAHAPGERPAHNGLGIAALVLGIAGSVAGLVWALFWLADVLGLLALALGLIVRRRTTYGDTAHRGVATFAVALGLIALALSGIGAGILRQAPEEPTRPSLDTYASYDEATALPPAAPR